LINSLRIKLLLLLLLLLCLPDLGAQTYLDFSVYNTKGFEGKGPLEFSSPEDIVITREGLIILADHRNNRLQILSSEGEFVGAIPNTAKIDESKLDAVALEARQQNLAELTRLFKKPVGLALDAQGRLYVTMMETDKIAIIDPRNGMLTGTLCKSGKGQGELYAPMDIDISHNGHIAVAEWRNRRVQILNDQGKCLKELIYQEETKRGSMAAVAPRGVHWTSEGKLVVSYPLFNQVVCWNPADGQVLWRYGGSKGSDKGMLNNPSFITASLNNNLLIADTLNHRIVEITNDGKYFEHHGRRGSKPGALLSPRGIALSRDEILVISDQGNNRIHFFQPGQTTLMLREIKQLALKDEWESAMPRIEQILYLSPNNPEAHELMVNALYFFGNRAFNEGDYDRAEEYYRRILRYRPEDPNIPQKLDAIFWAANQSLIASIVFGIIATIAGLILIWVLKTLISRFIFTQSQE
jgi:tetratricopeptide (TPR) repeat protein